MTRSRKIVMMLVALLGAVLLWLYVVTSVTPEVSITVSAIPVSIGGVDTLAGRQLIITDQEQSSMTLDIKTTRQNQEKLNAESIRVNADASWITEPGEYDLDCTVTFPDTVRTGDAVLLSKRPETIHVTVTRYQEKTFQKIVFIPDGAIKDGYSLDAAVFEPTEIKISGPDSDVSQIDRAVVYYNVSDLEETVEATVDVVFLNEAGDVVELSEATTVTPAQVRMTLPVYRTKKLTLAVDTVEGGGVTVENAEIDIEPKTVWVKGSAEIIDQLDDVCVLGELNLEDLEVDKDHVIPYTYSLPAGVTNMANMSGEIEAEVRVRISGVSEDTILVSDIRLENGPEEYLCEASTHTVRVTVRGSTAEIAKIKANENNGIYIRVDLSDYTDTGVYTIPGTVVNQTYSKVSVADTVDIGVVISAPQSEVEEPTGDEG